jgi:hypothetical protein
MEKEKERSWIGMKPVTFYDREVKDLRSSALRMF